MRFRRSLRNTVWHLEEKKKKTPPIPPTKKISMSNSEHNDNLLHSCCFLIHIDVSLQMTHRIVE